MTINEKFTVEERKEIEMTIAILGWCGAKNAPQTQEDFDTWCEEMLERKRVAEEKEAQRKARIQERNNQAGYKTKMNWKRKGTEITKLEKEIKAMQRKIAYLERARKELAKQYEIEVGEKIE